MFSWYPTEDTMTTRASGFFCTIFSAASIPSICGMVMSMSTMSGLMRSYSLMAVSPSPASPATWPPKLSTIRPRFLRAKTESSTIRYWTACPSLLRFTGANCSIHPPPLLRSNQSSRPAGAGGKQKSIFPGAHSLTGLPGASRAGVRLQDASQRVQFYHSHGVPTFNGGFRHSEDDAGLLALRDGHAARRFDQSQAVSAVLPHAGHQNADGPLPKLFSNALKHHVG